MAQAKQKAPAKPVTHEWRTVRAIGVEQIGEAHRSLEVDGFEIDFRVADGPGTLIIVAKRPAKAHR